MKSCLAYIFMLFCTSDYCVSNSIESEIPRPRGVAISKAPLYSPETDFTCFDGNRTIPFSHVNDDYCDCPDGSDEPGTSACENGYFHCTNAGHVPMNIYSSRVNDGICDCCDTSDEYDSSAQCMNNCKELGKLAQEEAAAKAELMRVGFEQRSLMAKAGQQKKKEMKARVVELETDKSTFEAQKVDLETKKNEIEEKEKVLLEKYKSEEEERKKNKEQEDVHKYMEMEKAKATKVFEDYDTDKDGKLTPEELMVDLRFDQNKDGTVTREEAKFFLHMKEYLEMEEFTTTGWMIMKPLVTAEPTYDDGTPQDVHTNPPFEEPKPTDGGEPNQDAVIDAPPTEQPDEEKFDHQEEEEDEEEPDYDDGTDPEDFEGENIDKDVDEEGRSKYAPDRMIKKMKKKFPLNQSDDKKDEEATETVYDEETQKAVDEANKARNEYDEAERKVRDLQDEINNLNEKINRDYGVDEEFASLQDDCVEYQHPEYTYKLCMFNKVTQASNSGGGETSLGDWGRWIGPENNKYSKMMYDRGQSCWNGPARSTEVSLSCGKENRITSVSEPSKCVYMLEMETPAVCSKPVLQEFSHDEL